VMIAQFNMDFTLDQILLALCIHFSIHKRCFSSTTAFIRAIRPLQVCTIPVKSSVQAVTVI
jgi:hypothetical protein